MFVLRFLCFLELFWLGYLDFLRHIWLRLLLRLQNWYDLILILHQMSFQTYLELYLLSRLEIMLYLSLLLWLLVLLILWIYHTYILIFGGYNLFLAYYSLRHLNLCHRVLGLLPLFLWLYLLYYSFVITLKVVYVYVVKMVNCTSIFFDNFKRGFYFLLTSLFMWH